MQRLPKDAYEVIHVQVDKTNVDLIYLKIYGRIDLCHETNFAETKCRSIQKIQQAR